MKIWWEFRCDLNHRWAVMAEEAEGEPPEEEATCPVDGALAVTATPQRPADRVSVSIVPAARVTDPVRKLVGHESEYYLEISSPDSSRMKRSAMTLSWDEAIRKASLFEQAPWDLAAARWARAGLDRSQNPLME
ncbi:hypothetical protein GCM10022251_31200 [Phytohabitans flavus]|uniref:Uncharacterized protein n=1 Tax=Phytohabitans flavus TaxID=1076124 RepID=A0A6F8XWS2_9ACTN|nr:hypothetical protein Pflav_046960 [Phytohabitans flavus]